MIENGRTIWIVSLDVHYILEGKIEMSAGSLVPSRPRRFRMWRHLSSLSGKFAKDSRYRTRFQASSGNSDSANWPGYQAGQGDLVSDKRLNGSV